MGEARGATPLSGRSRRPITDDLLVGEDGQPLSLLHPTSSRPARGFGGHVAAMALMSAYGTVPEALSVRHLHVEYIAAAPLESPAYFGVRSVQDGRSVARRVVEIVDDGRLVALVTITFHRRDDDGPEYQAQMPDAGDPGADAVEVPRQGVLIRGRDVGAGHFHTWMRPEVLPLAPDPRLQEAALVYLSDLGILWSTLTVHGYDFGLRKRALGTVAHSVWFHRRPHIDDWLLFDHTTPSTSSGLGHGEGRIFTHDGVLVATAAQTGLLRPGSSQAWGRDPDSGRAGGHIVGSFS
jgi:acyl-CoA thioesterase-2